MSTFPYIKAAFLLKFDWLFAMMYRRENILHQIPGNVPPRKRFRSLRSQQKTHLFYGFLFGILIMFDGVELYDQLQTNTDPVASPWVVPNAAVSRLPGKLVFYDKQKTTTRAKAGSSKATTKPTPIQTTEKPTVDDKTCTSSYCKKIASEVLYKMNQSVDPCDDFYSYACGSFVKNTEIPEDKTMVNTFSEFNDELRTKLGLTVGSVIEIDEIMPYRVAKNLFMLCIHKSRIEEQGTKPLLDKLDKLGGWPVLTGDDWTKMEPSWSWVKSMKDLRALGYSIDYFFDVTVGDNLKNRSRSVIHVDQATLGISREDLVKGKDNPNVIAYFNSMIEVAVSLGAKEARARQELQDSLNFEIDLARITLTNKKRRNATAMYNPMSVDEFQSKYPATVWVDYFNAMLKGTHIDIDENEIIIVRAPTFMEKLDPLLRDTPKRILANYVMWRVIQFSSSFLPEKLQRTVFSYEKQENRSRGEECIDITVQRMPIAVGDLYRKTYYTNFSAIDVWDMLSETVKASADIVRKVNWIDEITQTTVLRKIESMVFHSDYYELNEYYQDLELKPEDSYLDAILYIDQFSTNKKFEMLGQPVSATTTHLNPGDFKFRYSAVENIIRLAPLYLQDPFFSGHWPNYVNYGVIGSFIGRAITRSFDLGWKFDSIGNFADLCRTPSGVGFLEKAFCILKQDVDLKFSGYSTVAEKIADNGGIKLAYYAYKSQVEQKGPDKLLPDLNLTPEQMFWLLAAQNWCSVYRPEAINKGSTSPDRFRVLESMSNLIEFSKDFNCPSESPMNPAERCNVW